MKILIAEDDPQSALLLKTILARASYEVDKAVNGREAFDMLKSGRYDALLTDWMMPEMDGVELIRRVRSEKVPCPLIIMLTAIDSREARQHALQAGADDFLVKPYNREQLLKSLENGLSRLQQPVPQTTGILAPRPSGVLPPFVGVVVAVSTGGPPVLIELFKALPPTCEAAFFVVQHGPKWMLETFASTLERETKFKFTLASEGMPAMCGQAYLSPGEQHLYIHPGAGSVRLGLSDGPPENFVKPAADPLFHSAAGFFGRYCVGVVLTGMGRDGVKGASYVKSAGGTILVQDPETAVASSMPRTVVSAGLADKVLPLAQLGESIVAETLRLSVALKMKLKNQ